MFSFLKTFREFVKPYTGTILVAVFFMLLVDLTSYLLPLAISYITDSLYPHISEPGMLNRLLWLCGFIIAGAFIRGWFAHIMIRLYWASAESIVQNLRNALYTKLQNLDCSFYDQARTGDLMSRVTTDIQLIRNFFSYGIEHRVRITLITITIFIFMLFQSWQLALLIYVLIPAVYLILIRFSKKMRLAVDRKQTQIGVLASRLQENLAGIRIVKAFAMEKNEIAQFARENKSLKTRETEMALLQVYLNPLLLIVNGLGSLLILLYGGLQVINGHLSLGVLLAFISYLGIMGFPVNMLAFNTSLINLAAGAGRRVMEVLTTPDQKRHDTGSSVQPFDGTLSFENVSFAYREENRILDNISFEINAGEKVAIFGLTGAGKSTLISLIPRFYSPTEGRILIDGRNINEWELHSLRSQIGIVLQETFLFSTSIRENISFGRPEASFREIKQAARHAQIDDFIKALPNGYDTVIGEYGVGLSGGQRQRVAIARTLLQDPKLLILDDCTSSLDTITEQKIQNQLKELMKGRTTILIAQRMAAFAMADRIIVLNRGIIQGIDSHTRLLKTNPLYRQTYQAQLMESPMEDTCS
ncbi:MAG: ABC transporter ATP-binding protein [Spirochaetales bacterium]|nr:ABC transporter ATP-binding protein [Spirochaetales bacterium]